MPETTAGTPENRALRLRTARFSLGSAVTLCLLKFGVGIFSGSLGVLASALDNVADIFMSSVNLVSIRKAMDPADEDHPYGHGKVETLSTLFQAVVIALTGAGVVWEAVRRLREGRAPEGIGLDVGILVMTFSVIASWFISERIRKGGEAAGSTALAADSLHFRTDVYSGGGILASLVLYRITGWKWLDPGIALAVGVYICSAAAPLLKGAIEDLMDHQLPAETVERVKGIIEAHRPMVVDWHDLRTRRSGSEKQVDFHVVVCREHSLEEAHRVADHLEMEIREMLGNAHVVTHIDPCGLECTGSRECARLKGMVSGLHSPERDGKKAAVVGKGAAPLT
ncbi:MAG: cation transporter [Deltaproteobacteria bacterium]|nr:cation transporter [Deltaproteobacteria bacterium]